MLKRAERLLICDANLENSSVDWLTLHLPTFKYKITENIY